MRPISSDAYMFRRRVHTLTLSMIDRQQQHPLEDVRNNMIAGELAVDDKLQPIILPECRKSNLALPTRRLLLLFFVHLEPFAQDDVHEARGWQAEGPDHQRRSREQVRVFRCLSCLLRVSLGTRVFAPSLNLPSFSFGAEK